MPGQSQKPAQQQTPGTSPEVSGTSSTQSTEQDTLGNSAIQEKLEGQKAYQALLGEFLGGQLYSQIQDQLSDDKLVGLAQGVVDSALDKVRAFIESKGEPTEEEAANAFFKAIETELDKLAEGVVTESEAGDGIRMYADEHPRVMTAAALAGAVAYILSNQDIGMLKHSFGASNNRLTLGLDPGSTMNLALDRIHAKYSYKGDGNSFQILGNMKPNENSWDVTGQYQRSLDQGGNLSLTGHQAVSPASTLSRIALDYKQGPWAAGAEVERMRSGQGTVDALGGHLEYGKDDFDAYLRGQVRSDNSWETSAGFEQDLSKGSWGAEGYANRSADGMQDSGARVFYKIQF
jgi:hypothetical protein